MGVPLRARKMLRNSRMCWPYFLKIPVELEKATHLVPYRAPPLDFEVGGFPMMIGGSLLLQLQVFPSSPFLRFLPLFPDIAPDRPPVFFPGFLGEVDSGQLLDHG